MCISRQNLMIIMEKTMYSNLFSSIYFILKFIESCEINMYTGENENHIFKKV